MQRIRITFTRGDQTKYISHLDLMRFWERAFRRARAPLAYTEGFHPHPRFSLAAPLPVGVTGGAELMDVFLEAPVDLREFLLALSRQLVPGIDVASAEQVPEDAPSLQAAMRYADYDVTVETDRSREEVAAALAGFMAQETFPWEHLRDGTLRSYDLRRQVSTLEVQGWEPGRCVLVMRLQADSNAAGRPEQVARALGFPDHPVAIHRTRLSLNETISGGGSANARRAPR